MLVCERCGTFACDECARPRGASGVCVTCEERVGVVPWERRSEPEMGYARAAWLTFRDSLVRPSRLFAQRYRDPSAFPSIGYGMLVGLPIASVNLVYQLVGLDLDTLAQRWLPEPAPTASDAFVQTYGGICAFALSPLLYMLGLALKAGVWHVALRTMGVGKGAFDRTFRTFAYTEGTSVLALIPIVGQLLALLVGAVYACIALTAAHDTEWWRVVIAAIIVLALITTLCFGCVAVLAVGLFAAMPA